MIIIDPGHGGADPGGGSNQYWKEKDLNLKISKYQYDRFKELGIPVKMTRFTDETLTPRERVTRVNNAFGQDSNVVGISNHINKDFGRADGAEIFYSIYDAPDLAENIGKSFVDAGQNVRYVNTRTNSKGTDYYFIIRNTRPIKMNLIEYGYADSPGDDINKLLLDWETLAEAPIKPIVEYLGYEYQPRGYKLYTVKKDDTLYNIAIKYNTTVDTLVELNDLDSTTIFPNQKLKIPKNIEEFNTIKYVVQKGDTLSQIALNFDTSINSIKETNNLKDDIIYVNQVLNIPIKDGLTKHVVVKGDTLWDIARMYNSTVDKIIAYNNLDTDLLQVGQILFIPN